MKMSPLTITMSVDDRNLFLRREIVTMYSGYTLCIRGVPIAAKWLHLHPALLSAAGIAARALGLYDLARQHPARLQSDTPCAPAPLAGHAVDTGRHWLSPQFRPVF